MKRGSSTKSRSGAALSGNVTLDGSVNRGNDTLVFGLDAEDFSAVLYGSRVVIEGDDVSVDIPVGETGIALAFA